MKNKVKEWDYYKIPDGTSSRQDGMSEPDLAMIWGHQKQKL